LGGGIKRPKRFADPTGMNWVLACSGIAVGVAVAAALLATRARGARSHSVAGRFGWWGIGIVALSVPVFFPLILDGLIGAEGRADFTVQFAPAWIGTLWVVIALNWEELLFVEQILRFDHTGERRLPSIRNCVVLTRRRIAFALSATIPLLILVAGLSSYGWASPALQFGLGLDVVVADRVGACVFVFAGFVIGPLSWFVFPGWCLRFIGRLTESEITRVKQLTAGHQATR
jgi:hypothetical protein